MDEVWFNLINIFSFRGIFSPLSSKNFILVPADVSKINQQFPHLFFPEFCKEFRKYSSKSRLFVSSFLNIRKLDVDYFINIFLNFTFFPEIFPTLANIFVILFPFFFFARCSLLGPQDSGPLAHCPIPLI